jgi:hypothetical protein
MKNRRRWLDETCCLENSLALPRVRKAEHRRCWRKGNVERPVLLDCSKDEFEELATLVGGAPSGEGIHSAVGENAAGLGNSSFGMLKVKDAEGTCDAVKAVGLEREAFSISDVESHRRVRARGFFNHAPREVNTLCGCTLRSRGGSEFTSATGNVEEALAG